jgi:predicted phosphodiesterase
MAARLQPVLFIPDTHRPYHDKRAWSLVLKAARALKPEIIVSIGDFADFYSVSSHSKNPARVANRKMEVADVNRGLDELDALGAKRKEFIEGNHCQRLSRYLADRAPELFGLVGTPELLHLKKRGWSFTPYKDHTKIGRLHLTHDVGASGRNATFKALDTFQHSVVTGHSHRLQYVVEGTATGESKLSGMFGWLGDAKAVDYMHRFNDRKNWALGFGIGYHDTKTGVCYLTPVPIVRYTCVVNGQLFEAGR